MDFKTAVFNAARDGNLTRLKVSIKVLYIKLQYTSSCCLVVILVYVNDLTIKSISVKNNCRNYCYISRFRFAVYTSSYQIIIILVCYNLHDMIFPTNWNVFSDTPHC